MVWKGQLWKLQSTVQIQCSCSPQNDTQSIWLLEFIRVIITHTYPHSPQHSKQSQGENGRVHFSLFGRWKFALSLLEDTQENLRRMKLSPKVWEEMDCHSSCGQGQDQGRGKTKQGSTSRCHCTGSQPCFVLVLYFSLVVRVCFFSPAAWHFSLSGDCGWGSGNTRFCLVSRVGTRKSGLEQMVALWWQHRALSLATQSLERFISQASMNWVSVIVQSQTPFFVLIIVSVSPLLMFLFPALSVQRYFRDCAPCHMPKNSLSQLVACL